MKGVGHTGRAYIDIESQSQIYLARAQEKAGVQVCHYTRLRANTCFMSVPGSSL